jgi:iron(III) transport system permease protein
MIHRALQPSLHAAAAGVGLLAAVPFVYIIVRAVGAESAVWGRLWLGQIPLLIDNTIRLVLTTVLFSVGLGVGAAWLVERTDVPRPALWRLLLALPLAVPAYVAAICWLILLRRGGVVDLMAQLSVGLGRGELPLPPITNLWGATVVIGLCVFPYVFLPVGAALRTVDRALEEAARIAGQNAWATFWRVSVPLVAPAIVAGALLVALYTLSDFGTVAMLRYRTFTLAIYQQFGGQIDRSAAAILSLVLIGLALPLLAAAALAARRERWLGRVRWQPRRLVTLGRWRWPALLALALLVSLSLGVPLLVLGGLTLQGWLFPSAADRIWGINNAGLLRHSLHSVGLATTAATGAMLLALIPAFAAVRAPGRWSGLVLALCQSPFALPGVIIGLSLVLVLNRWVPLVYGTLVALLIGFVLRVLPQAVAANEAALRGVAPPLEQAARTLGCTTPGTLRRVTLPIAAPGLLAGWVLVFVTAMKELPTAMVLRPPGFDTLPVRIWAAASESVYTQAAPSAFALIVVTMTMLLLLARYEMGLDRVLTHG